MSDNPIMDLLRALSDDTLKGLAKKAGDDGYIGLQDAALAALEERQEVRVRSQVYYGGEK